MSLGPPLKKPPPDVPEWVPYKPGIERSTKDGKLRTVGEGPPPEPVKTFADYAYDGGYIW